jgi:hypothetical protein
MICCFCSAHVDDVDDAVEAGWVPDFYVGGVEYEGPVCVPCQRANLRLGDDGELELRPGVDVPPLAIPLRPHPNLGHGPEETAR